MHVTTKKAIYDVNENFKKRKAVALFWLSDPIGITTAERQTNSLRICVRYA